MFANEAVLTGESVPVEKKSNDKAFMGTIVSGGQAILKVEKTGEETEIGKIAQSVQEISQETPLRLQLKKFSKQLTVMVIVLVSSVFIIGLATGMPVVEIFTTSVALSVASIPEGLLVGLTVVLAVGMQRILARKGLVRNLVSAETLGGVTTICTDKTGTLTEGNMKVVTTVGNEVALAKQIFIANDLDDPLVVSAHKWSKSVLKKAKESTLNWGEKYERIDSLPFSSKNRFFASLNKWDGGKSAVLVNGAPDYLLEWSKLSAKEKKEITEQIEKLTGEGKRLMGLAMHKAPKSKKKLSDKDIKNTKLEWLGIIVFSDPIRKSVAHSLKLTKQAGVDLLVITGDYAKTAVSIMNNAGIDVDGSEVILGEELSKMSEDQLRKHLKDKSVKLFARTTPEQKLTIVNALKENGEVIAMLGDGVNDAPALSKADIGIVVNEATDVAKESADLILLDSKFDTIIAAIEEGRGIFNNIRKIIMYLMCDAFGEIVAVLGTIIISAVFAISLPLPVSAVQILWINLVSDGFPHLALTVDPKDPGIMNRRPRNPEEPLVTNWMKELIFVVSIAGGVIALILFLYVYRATGDATLSQTVAFATLGINSLFYVFSIRTLSDPFWKVNPLENKWLNIAVVAGFILQLTPFFLPAGREFLGLAVLPANYWIMIFAASVFMFIIIEVLKVFVRHTKS